MMEALEFKRGHEEKWKTVINLKIEQPRWKISYDNNFERCIESSLRPSKYNITTNYITNK